jgi:50S ribosomal subunit-associated GTPase HflX
MVIAEVLVDKLIVVINKCDLIKDAAINLPRIKERLRDRVFKGTKFGRGQSVLATQLISSHSLSTHLFINMHRHASGSTITSFQ